MGGYRDPKRGDGFVFGNGSSRSSQPAATAGPAACTTAGPAAAGTPTTTTAGTPTTTTAGTVHLEHN